MNNADVLWVGVSLDAADNPRVPRSHLIAAHDIIVSAVTQPAIYSTRTLHEYPSGAQLDIYTFDRSKGEVMDLFDALGFRIGFGIKVKDVEQGKSLVPKVRDWMTELGVRLPVSVWAWSPASVPSYTIRRVNARMTNVRRP